MPGPGWGRPRGSRTRPVPGSAGAGRPPGGPSRSASAAAAPAGLRHRLGVAGEAVGRRGAGGEDQVGAVGVTRLPRTVLPAPGSPVRRSGAPRPTVPGDRLRSRTLARPPPTRSRYRSRRRPARDGRSSLLSVSTLPATTAPCCGTERLQVVGVEGRADPVAHGTVAQQIEPLGGVGDLEAHRVVLGDVVAGRRCRRDGTARRRSRSPRARGVGVLDHAVAARRRRRCRTGRCRSGDVGGPEPLQRRELRRCPAGRSRSARAARLGAARRSRR